MNFKQGKNKFSKLHKIISNFLKGLDYILIVIKKCYTMSNCGWYLNKMYFIGQGFLYLDHDLQLPWCNNSKIILSTK